MLFRSVSQSRYGGRGGSAARMNPPPRTPSRESYSTAIVQPRLYPIIDVSRLVEDSSFNVVCDGINPSLNAFNFSLNDVPGYTEFTSMFQMYCIEQIEVWFRPEYTVLSDAAAISNSVNVEFNSAIDLVDGSAPASVNALLEYQNCAHTSIVSNHYRKFKPGYLLDSVMSSCGFLSTASPSSNWYGLKVAVPPTGIAMTFRATIKYKIKLASLK